jgi:hypothetical protein
MVLRCHKCDGYLRREPACLTCLSCGRFTIILDASPVARLLQLVIDRERRPRSVETTPPYNKATFLGPRRRLGTVQPGPRLPVGLIRSPV